MSNEHIPTAEIEADLKITQEELKSFEIINEQLMKNPTENKLQIYFNEAKIFKGQRFINQLQNLLTERKND